MAEVSRGTMDKIMKNLSVEEGGEDEIQMAIGEYVKAKQKGDERKTEKAQKDLEKVAKKAKLKMRDVEKALEKAGI